MIVLKGRVLDGNGGAPIEKGAVVLEDDRIRLVCRQSELPDDPTAEVYELEDGTSFIIRPSGTEPKIKVYILCSDATQEAADAKVAKYADFAQTIKD